MNKLVIVLTADNNMGSLDKTAHQNWVQKITPETKRFYEIPYEIKNPVLIGAKTFLGAATKQRFLDILSQYQKIIVVTQRSAHQLMNENENLKKINNWESTNNGVELVKQYYQNPNQDLFILGGWKIYQDVIKYVDEIIILRTPWRIVKLPYHFNWDFKKWHKVDEQIGDDFSEEIWRPTKE